MVAPDDSLYLVAADYVGNSAGSTLHLDPQGKVDLKYGTGGFAKTFAAPLSGALQADGKLLIVGRGAGGTGGIVARLNADGTPDRNFGPQTAGPGANTVAAGGLPGNNVGNVGVSARDDGEILVAFDGQIGTGASTVYYAGQLRFAPNGVLRTTYGAGGGARATDGISLAMFIRNDPASISKGSVALVAAGPAGATSSPIAFIQRTVDNGSDPDPNVSPNPQVSTVNYTVFRATGNNIGAAVLGDGTSVVPVTHIDQTLVTAGFFLRKFSATGGIPTGYGSSGMSVNFDRSAATGIALAPDESTLVSCIGDADTSPAGVYRIKKDGSQDTNWNIARIDVPTGFVGPVRTYTNVVLEKSGRVVTAVALKTVGGGVSAGLASFWL